MTSVPQSAPARVVSNRRLNPEVHELVLRLPVEWGPPEPGQFVQVECLPANPFVLKRPFSIARSRLGELGMEVHLVYGAIGAGTEALTRRRPGEMLELIGPLGRGFRPVPGRRPVLVGGGRGVAPMIALADGLAPNYEDGILIFGARGSAQLYELEDVPYPVTIATDDGSVGFHGNVIQLLEQLRGRGELRPEENALYSCGPNPMLHALSDWAGEHGFPCQVSLETIFGCGFGICAGCAVPVRAAEGEESDEFGHYRFACVEGPVFEGQRVDWEGVKE